MQVHLSLHMYLGGMQSSMQCQGKCRISTTPLTVVSTQASNCKQCKVLKLVQRHENIIHKPSVSFARCSWGRADPQSMPSCLLMHIFCLLQRSTAMHYGHECGTLCRAPLICRAPPHAPPPKCTSKPWRRTVMHHGLKHGFSCRVPQVMPAFCLCASEEMHTHILGSQEPLHGYHVCPWTCQTSCNRHSRPWQPSTKVGTCNCETYCHTCAHIGTYAYSHAHCLIRHAYHSTRHAQHLTRHAQHFTRHAQLCTRHAHHFASHQAAVG